MGNVKWFNGEYIFHSKAWLYMICSNRGIGKSFFFKQRLCTKSLKTERRFIYLRRNEIDLHMAIGEFNKDISKIPFLSAYTAVLKKKMYLYFEKEDEDGNVEPYLVGYCYSLNTIDRVKSIPLDDVDTILFDEFLPDKDRYLHPDNPYYEPEALLSLYITVARGVGRPIRDEVKLICLSNTVSRYNPYYSYFNIDMTGTNKFYNKDFNTCAEIVFNESVANIMLDSKLGSVLSQTRYGRYAVSNDALRDDPRNVLDKLPDIMYYKYGIYNTYWFSVWLSENGYMIFREGYDKSHKLKFCIANQPPNMEVPLLSKPMIDMIRRFYSSDHVRYESQRAKNVIGGYFERRVIK